MSKTKERPKQIKSLYKAAVRFGGGGWGKNTGRLGVKVAASLCNSKIREEFFVNASLRVIISLDPETDKVSVIAGLEDEYQQIEIDVKVNQHSTNDSDVSFGMTFNSTEMDANFLKMVSHAPGSLYILTVKANEDGTTTTAEDDEDEDAEE